MIEEHQQRPGNWDDAKRRMHDFHAENAESSMHPDPLNNRTKIWMDFGFSIGRICGEAAVIKARIIFAIIGFMVGFAMFAAMFLFMQH